MRKFLGTVFIVILVMFFAGCILTMREVMHELHFAEEPLEKPSILTLKLEGVILDGSEFLEDLREYAGRDDIKGVLVQINSPGGVVGPSQEIFSELKRVREVMKKPVVASVLSMAASGAYYSAVAADKIVTNPGSLIGSIGVILEFANLEKLYEWAKVQRYTITTGKYKDSGAEYRAMREDERALFQELADDVLRQFKQAVAESRKLSPNIVDKYSDGRVMTGELAVSLGFADQVGSYHDAVKLVGQLSGLGEDPELFEPPPKRPDFLSEIFSEVRSRVSVESQILEALRANYLGQPLLIMPSALQFPAGK